MAGRKPLPREERRMRHVRLSINQQMTLLDALDSAIAHCTIEVDADQIKEYQIIRKMIYAIY